MPRILLDANLPLGLKLVLRGHEVATAFEMGWSLLTNGALIEAAERAGFNVMITADQNIAYQQNLTGRMLAIIELSTNHWPTIRPDVARLVAAVEAIRPGDYVTVAFPKPPRRRRPFGPTPDR